MNTVVLIGRLVRDPENRFTTAGKAVTTFTLAVDRNFTNQAGEREADFIPIVVWGKIAETCANHLSKGRLVAVEGRLQIRNYETQDGQKRKVAEVVANSVQFLDRAKGETKPDNKTSDGPDFGEIDLDDLPF
jgi:single-strand DNA-binding protein